MPINNPIKQRIAIVLPELPMEYARAPSPSMPIRINGISIIKPATDFAQNISLTSLISVERLFLQYNCTTTHPPREAAPIAGTRNVIAPERISFALILANRQLTLIIANEALTVW
jgi:hypothetical protein